MEKKRILVVDDEKHVRQLVKKILVKEGYQVSEGENGFDAMETLQREDVDVIISDIKMPKMDGLTFLLEAKKLDPSIGFILITAFATMETAISAIKNGADDYVTKPFDIDEILHAVSKLTSGSSHGNSIIKNIETTSNSTAMGEVLTLAKQAADSEATIIITGETGTGKEVLASSICQWSDRKDNPFIKVNCGAIPDTLLESEFFGHEKGAFTGAVTTKLGRFEIADGGTIFLDEIGDISPSLQVKLLRVLQEKSFERLGGLEPIKVDVRVIAATNKNLLKEVKEGRFREDLYYRLNVVPLHLPPLRERKEDIEELVNHFLQKSAKISGKRTSKTISEEALVCLKNYSWPGNIRELENIVERCVVLTKGDQITRACLPKECAKEGEPIGGLSHAVTDKEREIILAAIKEQGGNKTKAALSLGISRRSLHRKIQKYEKEGNE